MRLNVIFATFFVLLGVSAAVPAALDREQSQEFFEDAVDYFRAESYTQAIIQLRNALQQDPNNLPARILLGETLLREDQSEAAIKELEKAQSMGGDENLRSADLNWLLCACHAVPEEMHTASKENPSHADGGSLPGVSPTRWWAARGCRNHHRPGVGV